MFTKGDVYMNKIKFYGHNVSYNIHELRSELNSKGIYLDSYEFDDLAKIMYFIDEYQLDILKISPEPVDNSESWIALRGYCDTEVAKNSYQEVLEIASVIKRNLRLFGYSGECSDKMPSTWRGMLNYVQDNIILIKYPVKEDDSNFHSFYLCDELISKPIIFINSNEYLDNQNFYLAHELYHHFYKDRDDDKADFFAANLLLPNEVFIDFDFSKLLESIVKIQNLTGAPYKAVIKALYNRGFICKGDYNYLKSINPRDKSGDYYKIIKNTYDDYNFITAEISIPEFVQKIMWDNFKAGKISISDYLDDLDIINGKK